MCAYLYFSVDGLIWEVLLKMAELKIDIEGLKERVKEEDYPKEVPISGYSE